MQYIRHTVISRSNIFYIEEQVLMEKEKTTAVTEEAAVNTAETV